MYQMTQGFFFLNNHHNFPSYIQQNILEYNYNIPLMVGKGHHQASYHLAESTYCRPRQSFSPCGSEDSLLQTLGSS